MFLHNGSICADVDRIALGGSVSCQYCSISNNLDNKYQCLHRESSEYFQDINSWDDDLYLPGGSSETNDLNTSVDASGDSSVGLRSPDQGPGGVGSGGDGDSSSAPAGSGDLGAGTENSVSGIFTCLLIPK